MFEPSLRCFYIVLNVNPIYEWKTYLELDWTARFKDLYPSPAVETWGWVRSSYVLMLLVVSPLVAMIPMLELLLTPPFTVGFKAVGGLSNWSWSSKLGIDLGRGGWFLLRPAKGPPGMALTIVNTPERCTWKLVGWPLGHAFNWSTTSAWSRLWTTVVLMRMMTSPCESPWQRFLSMISLTRWP